MNSLAEEPKLIPFIICQDNEFVLTQEAENFLTSLSTQKLAIISIIGKSKTGKTSFLNRAFLNKNPNSLSIEPEKSSCIRGLWIWNQLIKCDNSEYQDMGAIVIDTEGFSLIDNNQAHERKLLLFCLLLSSLLIFNSIGPLDDGSLLNTNELINLAKEILINSKTPAIESENAWQYFPSFLWILRDIIPNFLDLPGNSQTPKEYLESCLAPQKGVSDLIESKNRIRRLLKHFFKERDCMFLMKPIDNENKLNEINHMKDEELRVEYIEQLRLFKKKILKKIKAKMINGKTLNGFMIAEIIKAYLSCINSGNAPNIDLAWKCVCQQESQKVMNGMRSLISDFLFKIQEILEIGESRLYDLNTKATLTQSDISAMKNKIKEDLVQMFQKRIIGNNDTEMKSLTNELLKRFKEKFSKFKLKNLENRNVLLKEWLANNSILETKLRNQEYNALIEFKFDHEKFKQQYDQEATSGPNKQIIWLEYSNKLMNLAYETFLSKKDMELQGYRERLEKIQLVQKEENMLIEQKHGEQLRKLVGQVEDLQRENAILRNIQENLEDKLNEMKGERERLKKNFEDLAIRKCEDELIIFEQTKERTKQLETKVDHLKDQNSQQVTILEKKIILLEQEKLHMLKEQESNRERIATLEIENSTLKDDISAYMQNIEEIKKKFTKVEVSQQEEILSLKIELERLIYDANIEAERRKAEVKLQDKWLIEKANLEKQVEFFKDQLEENKRLHNALLIAVENGTYKAGNEDNMNDLVQTNKNLSLAVDKLQIRCKMLEQKLQKNHQFKKILKNASFMTCINCNKIFSNHIFPNHINECTTVFNTHTNSSIMSTTNDIYCKDLKCNEVNLQITISQTLIKDGDGSKPFIEYTIQVGYPNELERNVRRKYKEFYQLHQSLTSMFPNIDFPESPFMVAADISYMGTCKKPLVIEERRKALQEYLKELSKISLIRESEPFVKFLELEYLGKAMINPSLNVSALVTEGMTHYNSKATIVDERFIEIKEPEIYDVYENRPLLAKNTPSKRFSLQIGGKLFPESPNSFMKKWGESSNSKENYVSKTKKAPLSSSLIKTTKQTNDNSSLKNSIEKNLCNQSFSKTSLYTNFVSSASKYKTKQHVDINTPHKLLNSANHSQTSSKKVVLCEIDKNSIQKISPPNTLLGMSQGIPITTTMTTAQKKHQIHGAKNTNYRSTQGNAVQTLDNLEIKSLNQRFVKNLDLVESGNVSISHENSMICLNFEGRKNSTDNMFGRSFSIGKSPL